MRSKSAVGLLLGAWLLWMLLTAPARLLTAALPAGIGVGELAGTVWQGEARDIVWRGAGLAHLRWRLAFSGALPGWQISFSDPSGLRGLAWLQGLSALTLRDARLIVPAGVAGRGLTQAGSVDAEGLITLEIAEARFSPAGCQQISEGRARWQDATLSSPAGSLTLASVSGKFSCTPAGALALSISQDSHQLSLSGQGTLAPDGSYAFRGTLQSRQSTPALLAALIARGGRQDEHGRTPWQLQGKWSLPEKP